MAAEIRPTTPDDLPALGDFLRSGFAAPADAAFAAVDVLRWKYFDPCGPDAGDAPRSLLGVDAGDGRVVGHIGNYPGRFRGPGMPAAGVPTSHMMDWLSGGGAVGLSLMRRSHKGVPTQYGLGGSDAARAVGLRGGYTLVTRVPVYRRVLRLAVPPAGSGGSPVRRALSLARDALRLARPARKPRRAVQLQAVAAFGGEVDPILEAYRRRASFTSRGPELLNHFLRHPRGGLTGWHLLAGGRLRGFAVLGLRAGPDPAGSLAECLLDDPDDADLWHACVAALTAALRSRGAASSSAVAGTPWAAAALRATGYRPAYDLGFYLRDRDGLVPREGPFHVTALEADYAYT